MSDGIDYYDLQAAKDELQRQVWDLQRRLESMEADLSQRIRDSFRETHDGFADLGSRISRCEEGLKTLDAMSLAREA